MATESAVCKPVEFKKRYPTVTTDLEFTIFVWVVSYERAWDDGMLSRIASTGLLQLYY